MKFDVEFTHYETVEANNEKEAEQKAKEQASHETLLDVMAIRVFKREK